MPDELTLESSQNAFEAGDYARALELIEELPAAARNQAPVAMLARKCYSGLGEVSLALGEVTRLRRTGDTEALRRQARGMLGRLREADPSWLPPVTSVADVPEPPRRNRLLHLMKESLPYSQSGYTLRSRMTLEAQNRGGYEPVVVTSLGFPAYKGVESTPDLEYVDSVRHHRLPVPPEWTSPIKRIPFDVVLTEQTRKTSQICAEERPALIQAASGFRGFDQALVGLAIARAYDLPFVYEVRGFLEGTWSSRLDLQEQGELYRRRRIQDERCMHEADLVITIAGSMYDELVRREVDPDKVLVIPNAVDVDRFAPRPKKAELTEELRIGGRFVLGYVSNLGRREGIEYLIRATGELVAAGRDVACLIVGDGPERKGLTELIADLGLDESVRMTGHVPNEHIEDYYAQIDAFVVPRVNDRAARLVTPLKPLEAMSMKIPLVVSDLPALREIAKPGERGLVAAPGDVSDIARAVADLMDDENLRNSLAASAYNWVAASRTIDANVERYQSALSRLL